MIFDILVEKIENNKFDEAICIISEIGRDRIKDAVPILIKYLKKTNNNKLRNEIAIALSDIGNPIAVKPLIDMIKHTKTKGNRGTLLYALESFDYSEHIELLVDLLNEDSFEVSRQSLMLIEPLVKHLPDSIKQKYMIKIKNKILNLQDKIDFLSESLDVLMMK
jgi:HEAT repeat protein